MNYWATVQFIFTVAPSPVTIFPTVQTGCSGSCWSCCISAIETAIPISVIIDPIIPTTPTTPTVILKIFQIIIRL